GAILISVEFCIVIGVFLSFVLYVPRAAHVKLTPLTPTPEGGLRDRRPGDTPSDRLVAFELEGGLFFGAQPELAKHLATIEQAGRGKVRAVILVLSRGRNPDAAFLSLLRELHERLRSRGVTLLLYGVQTDMTTALGASGLQAIIGARRIFPEGPAGHPFGI